MCKSFDIKECKCPWIGGCTPICDYCRENTMNIEESTYEDFMEWSSKVTIK